MTDDAASGAQGAADGGADAVTPADRELLAALAEAWGPEPLPEGIIERVEALLTWADVDAELAELLESPTAELAGTRGAPALAAGSTIEFQVGDGSVVVEVDVGGTALEGQVLGIEAGSVVLERPAGDSASAPVDGVGRFSIPDPTTGPVRLRVVTGSGSEVRTDWFVL